MLGLISRYRGLGGLLNCVRPSRLLTASDEGNGAAARDLRLERRGETREMSAVIPMSVKPLVKRIRIAEPMIGERELEYVTDAVRRGEISSIGPYVDRFERAFADYCETEHGVCTANGTVALHLVLEALGIDEGDEVIVPALTFVATANAVVHARGVPVFADIDPQHWGLDPEQVRRRITKKTK